MKTMNAAVARAFGGSLQIERVLFPTPEPWEALTNTVVSPLSPRERAIFNILERIGQGRSNKEIARDLVF
jgi:DNA-binding NarL/FixJ family response regulator